MISREDNEILTRVGPGTPMGSFMREFWTPACLSRELVADRAPLRIMLLGEKLIGFRDSEGRVGILDHLCPHRCASLFFGRNEQGGLRCVYHGWKFDVEGNCLEMPNVPPSREFSARIKAKAYPATERGGIVWVYMGPAETPPPLPELDALRLDNDQRGALCAQRECNWLQSLEGDIDTSHFGFLHLGSVAADDVDHDNIHSATVLNRAPEYHYKETDWGTMYAAYREASQPDSTYYRVSHFHFPFWTQVPDGSFEDNIIATANVPMDDTHTMGFFISYRNRTAPMRRLKDGRPIPGLEPDAERHFADFDPDDSDWFGRHRPTRRASNDYMVDRDAQARDNFSGLTGVFTQDTAMVESMGAIVDRTKEHLAPSDMLVARTRRRLLGAVKAYMKDGTLPAIARDPTISRSSRSGSFVAPSDKNWLDAYETARSTAFDPLKA